MVEPIAIPIAIARALKLVSAHPAVRDVRTTHVSADEVIADIDIENELPSAWRAAGISPTGVKSLETVTLSFPALYPAFAPQISLRMDFNRSHPHINPGPADQQPRPCVIAGSPRELIQARGIVALIDRLVAWLDDAMMAKLNDPKTGWEPVRRDNVDDFMIVDGESLRAFATSTGGCVAVPISFNQLDDAETQLFAVDHRSSQTVDIIPQRFTRKNRDQNIWHGQSVGLIVWAPDAAPGYPFAVDEYLPETVAIVSDLRDRAHRYGCLQQLDAKLNHLAHLADDGQLPAVPVTVTFLVRRPFNLIGSTSKIELCSYLIDASTLRSLKKFDAATVRLCALREQLSLQVLRRASDLAENAERPKWTLVGCGSVGSKIAMHTARQGRGPSLVIDKGFMLPHNYARHSLLPTDASERSPLASKAQLLADDLARLKQRPDVERSDVIITSATAEGRARIEQAGNQLLLNTTASTVVREQLSFIDWKSRPPLAEAHLLGAGRAAYAAFEGPNANPSLSDLAVESYRLIAANDELREIVFSAEAETIQIGQGCTAETFPMADDRLSALAAGLSEVAGQRLSSLDDAAELHLARLGNDGLSQTWSRHVVPPWIIVENDNFSVRISTHADAQIRVAIAARPGTETGGVIVGRFSETGNAFQVVDVLPAPPDSTFSPEKFVLGTVGVKEQIDQLVHKTRGALYVLGTWHSHLVTSGPSGLDAATAVKLALSQYLPTLLLIALPGAYTFCAAESYYVGLLTPERDDDNTRELSIRER